MQNVVLAQHLGTVTREVRTRMALWVAENVIAFLDGKEPGYDPMKLSEEDLGRILALFAR